jgi:DNA modification methylase/DNA-directed RNA polymerase subunit M/transcription elongation factor TFIIS
MANTTQVKMFGSGKDAASQQPVECLGIKFPNDEARRGFFLEKLRQKLKEPAFRKIEGFPVGSDEDILALSDPPYYTACPNPFLPDVVDTLGKAYSANGDSYDRKPFASDVSEGKNDPIYNAHSYHTKVPHKAIVRYILHYTAPGDLVFDGFCGTGMTGVAAHVCGDRSLVASLGYTVKSNGMIQDKDGKLVSQLGVRFAVLNDLSPAATFISENYNRPLHPRLVQAAECLIESVEEELGWLYQTRDKKTGKISQIESVIWSDVFLCPDCSHEIVFWSVARSDDNDGGVTESFPCPKCKARLTKTKLDHCIETIAPVSGKTVRRIKRIPVAIISDHSEKRVEADDFDVLAKAATRVKNAPLPTLPFDPNSEQYKRDALHLRGVKLVADFYTSRNLLAMSTLWEKAKTVQDSAMRRQLLWLLTSAQWLVSVMYRFRTSGGGGQQGKLTIPSLMKEQNVFTVVRRKLNDIAKAGAIQTEGNAVSTGSTTQIPMLPSNSIDYIFTDPPFGGNLYYSDLNRIWEGWLGVSTNEEPEAVIHRARTVDPKTLVEYTDLMRGSFQEAYRILKPGRWITVEFHNSSNAVWNAIQEALTSAKFVVADVRTLDKKQGTFKQVTDLSSVKQDPVITAYKPTETVEAAVVTTTDGDAKCWTFVENHLRHLPVVVERADRLEVIAERQNYLLFDRMVAFYVQRGIPVPVSGSEFYSGLRQRFASREGMYFLPDQAIEYDRSRLNAKGLEQLELFVSNEKSAIQWVRLHLGAKPMAYQELQPLYMREAQRVWDKHEQPLELQVILDQGFVKGSDGRWSVPDPKKEGDLEQIRTRALMKEFQQYLDVKGKLKIVRTEALRVGFKECWQKQDYMTIVQLAKRVPETVIQEDEAILMYFDNALMRSGK